MLPRLIKKQMPNLIGLDISTASIKLIELGLKPDGYRVEHYAMVPLPHGVIEDEIKDPASVIHCVKKAIEESQTSIQSVAIAVPDFLVVKKIFQFPMSLKKEEIKNYIE
ncbi:MAG: pilus assembly protein PilM, partial [Proteobacteria bacterium]|nr:pilus assembly protein PilM [Pseudomonadota bacterium]